MKDAQYERLKRRIERVFDAWRLRLGLRWWSVKLVFERAASPHDDKDEELAAEVKTCQWKYLRASIHCYMPALSTLSPADLEAVIVHELCHLLVNEMRESDEDRKHEERVVSTMTSAFLWTLHGDAKRPNARHKKKGKPR